MRKDKKFFLGLTLALFSLFFFKPAFACGTNSFFGNSAQTNNSAKPFLNSGVVANDALRIMEKIETYINRDLAFSFPKIIHKNLLFPTSTPRETPTSTIPPAPTGPLNPLIQTPVPASPSAQTSASTPVPTSTPTDTTTTGATTTATVQLGTDTQTIGMEIFNLMNKQREANGLPDLKYNPLLAKAGENHDLDMLALHYFAHNRPGKNFYDFATELGITYSRIGENIATGFTSADGVVTAWMNSAPHREAILSSSFAEAGVGVERNPNGTLLVSCYFLQ